MKYALSLLPPLLTGLFCSAQITNSTNNIKFGVFNISFQKKPINQVEYLALSISRGSQVALTDSVLTNVNACTGFSVPQKQPLADYFIFCKREKHNGKIYILTKAGELKVIPGGTFWAAPKHKLLFILAERDYTNLLIYDLKQMKTILEKFNCDEFSGWYYSNGNYVGKVLSECAEEGENEHEVSGVVSQLAVEQFDTKTSTLNEVHLAGEDLEKLKPLVKIANCK